MLDQRQRRWDDAVQMLCKCFVFAGSIFLPMDVFLVHLLCTVPVTARLSPCTLCDIIYEQLNVMTFIAREANVKATNHRRHPLKIHKLVGRVFFGKTYFTY